MDYLEKGSPVRQNIRQDVYNSTNFVGRVDAQSLSVNDIQISTTIENQHTLDVESLLGAVMADPFDIEQWKSSYTVSFPDGSTVNGLYSTSGDFSSEDSYWNLIGIDGDGNSFFGSASFFPELSGGVLDSLQSISNSKTGGSINAEWTYSYEEDSSATGSNPKYLHDFRLTIDSTQILGYVVVNADDSESHNFIIDSAAG